MASVVGNPTGATSAERLTGGREAPGGPRFYNRAGGQPDGGARRAAQQTARQGLQQKEATQSVRQQAVARAANRGGRLVAEQNAATKAEQAQDRRQVAARKENAQDRRERAFGPGPGSLKENETRGRYGER